MKVIKRAKKQNEKTTHEKRNSDKKKCNEIKKETNEGVMYGP